MRNFKQRQGAAQPLETANHPSEPQIAQPPPNRLHLLLSRPIQQRMMEFKYRFAQAVIFGLPVLALQWFGYSLGGSSAESQRWIGILQTILSGWVTYIAAAGMLVEGFLMFAGKALIDAIVGAMAISLYLYSFVSVLGVFMKGVPLYQPLLFHWCVILLTVWCGGRWWFMRSAP